MQSCYNQVVPQITAIKPQKRENRFNIYVDGEFSFGLDAESLVRVGLKVDQEISQEEIEKLIKENEFGKVYDRVLQFFSYRPRSGKELTDWFGRKKVGEETQKLVKQKVGQLGYLNDEEFAKWWVEQRTTFRPAGTRLLAMELRQKGIPREIISHITCHISQINERELARKVAEKKLKTLKNLPLQEREQKLTAFLLRRGFSWETIKAALKLDKSTF